MKSKCKPAKKAATKRRRKPRAPRIGNVTAAIKSLRAAGLDAWDKVADPEALLREIRGSEPRDTDAPALRPGQPAPRFRCTAEGGGDVIVKVPAKVCESGQAIIAGREWGPDSRGKGTGWVYLLQERRFTPVFVATEEELIQWTRSA